jgi:RNA polymerase sigma-70 factor (ECF subfamily)
MDDILQRLKNNDERAFRDVFNSYKAPVYYYILKIVHDRNDTEDLMMITFEKAFSGVKKFVPNFKLSTWIYEIAKNTSIDYLRAKHIVPQELDVKIKSKQLDPEQELIIRDQYERVVRGIDNLPQHNFKAIMTMYKDGLKIKEICKELRLPHGTVVNSILRAKKELKKLIA